MYIMHKKDISTCIFLVQSLLRETIKNKIIRKAPNINNHAHTYYILSILERDSAIMLVKYLSQINGAINSFYELWYEARHFQFFLPVPPAISSSFVPGVGASRCMKISFHSLCTPADITSFIRSYLSATVSNTSWTEIEKYMYNFLYLLPTCLRDVHKHSQLTYQNLFCNTSCFMLQL